MHSNSQSLFASFSSSFLKDSNLNIKTIQNIRKLFTPYLDIPKNPEGFIIEKEDLYLFGSLLNNKYIYLDKTIDDVFIKDKTIFGIFKKFIGNYRNYQSYNRKYENRIKNNDNSYFQNENDNSENLNGLDYYYEHFYD